MAMTVKVALTNPAKIVTPNAVNAAVETAEASLEGEVETAQIADAAVTAAKLADDAVETAKIKDGAVTAEKLAEGLGGVQILGVSLASFAGTQALTASWANVSGLSAAVTVAAGERVLLFASVMMSGRASGLRLARNSTALAAPTGIGLKTAVMSATGYSTTAFAAATLPVAWIDAPAAGSYMYTVQAVGKGAAVGYINRSDYESDDSAYLRGVSTLVCVKLGPEVTP